MHWRTNIWTLANLVTALKIPLAAYFPQATRGTELELLVLVLGGASDFLDGHIARRMGQAGGFGAIFDPICDKIFLLTVVATYVAQGRLPLWAVGIVILRDAYVLLASAALIGSRRWDRFTIQARFWGKTVTFLQFVLFGFVALGLPYWLLLVLLLVASGIACYDYTAELLRQARRYAGLASEANHERTAA